MHEIHTDGRCTTSGHHDLFFSERPTDLAAAQAICAECPLRIGCLEYALENALEWGVWGGVIFWDGKPFHRKRSRGRPRHADAHLPLEATFEELAEMVRSA